MNKPSFYFYDLETSGISPRTSRIMQFAGQRTDLDLNPIGEPENMLVKLSPDILPEPEAILLTGITPQKVQAEGYSEAEFLDIFYKEVVRPGTIFIGYNNIRFDDEFMRFTNYRNFYDAYKWQWENGASRWDLLDVVRMTRALRPDGIEWPFAPDSKPTNRLEFLTKVNKLEHASAHDALGDVMATIALAKLIKEKQPSLFNYLLDNRTKNKVRAIIESNKPFVYTSGHYSSKYNHTSIAVCVARHSDQDAGLVFDLRYDPTPFINMTTEQLIEAWKYKLDSDEPRLPVKTIKYNRSPALAPLGVVSEGDSLDRLELNLDNITKHLKILKDNQTGFAAKLIEAIKAMDSSREKVQADLLANELSVDEQLYDGFIDAGDQLTMSKLRADMPENLASYADKLKDKRLVALLPLYKARNYPSKLDVTEREEWESYLNRKLFSGGENSLIARHIKRLDEYPLDKTDSEKSFLIEEMKLYAQSLIPADAIG